MGSHCSSSAAPGQFAVQGASMAVPLQQAWAQPCAQRTEEGVPGSWDGCLLWEPGVNSISTELVLFHAPRLAEDKAVRTRLFPHCKQPITVGNSCSPPIAALGAPSNSCSSAPQFVPAPKSSRAEHPAWLRCCSASCAAVLCASSIRSAVAQAAGLGTKMTSLVTVGQHSDRVCYRL